MQSLGKFKNFKESLSLTATLLAFNLPNCQFVLDNHKSRHMYEKFAYGHNHFYTQFYNLLSYAILCKVVGHTKQKIIGCMIGCILRVIHV